MGCLPLKKTSPLPPEISRPPTRSTSAREVHRAPDIYEGSTAAPGLAQNSLIRAIDKDLFCGPRPDAEMMQELAQLKIKTIVNLEDYHTYWGWFGWRTRDLAAKADITMVRQPMSPLFWVSRQRRDALVRILRDPARLPLYVHCLFGKERTNVVVALHRCINHQVPEVEAQQKMRAEGFRAHLVPLLASQIKSLLKHASKAGGSALEAAESY